MYYFRYDGKILDFTKSPLEERILKKLDNCFVKERKDRITLFPLNLTMACPGLYKEGQEMEFYMLLNRKKTVPTCDMCYFGMVGKGELCVPNSFFLPEHFHHRKADFKGIIAMLKFKGYLELPVPDPFTWSYMNFRY